MLHGENFRSLAPLRATFPDIGHKHVSSTFFQRNCPFGLPRRTISWQ